VAWRGGVRARFGKERRHEWRRRRDGLWRMLVCCSAAMTLIVPGSRRISSHTAIGLRTLLYYYYYYRCDVSPRVRRHRRAAHPTARALDETDGHHVMMMGRYVPVSCDKDQRNITRPRSEWFQPSFIILLFYTYILITIYYHVCLQLQHHISVIILLLLSRALKYCPKFTCESQKRESGYRSAVL